MRLRRRRPRRQQAAQILEPGSRLLPVLAMLWQPLTQAATITVDSTSDGFGLAECTLRAAIAAANNDAPAQGCAAGSGDDIIEFDRTVLGSRLTLQNGELAITSSLTITAAGGEPFIVSADNASPVFNIDDSTGAIQNVFLNNLVIRDGISAGSGGGIYNAENLTLDRCQVLNNSSPNGGGGVRSITSLTIDGTTISGNTAAAGAGGGVLSGLAFTLTNSEVTSNYSGTVGGGLNHSGGSITISGGSIAGNTAIEGGGLRVSNTTASLDSVQIQDNTATASGGGIYSTSGATVTLVGTTVQGNAAAENGGGGHFRDGTTLTVQSSTITQNTATESGGGLSAFDGAGTLQIFDSLISDNRAETKRGGGAFFYLQAAEITRTTISGNFAGQSGGALRLNMGSSVTISQSTINGNTANQAGSAISLIDGATALVTNSTFSANLGGTSTISPSLLGGAVLRHVTLLDNDSAEPGFGVIFTGGAQMDLYNTAIGGAAPNCVGAAGPTVSVNSAFSDTSCSIPGEVEPLVANLALARLADNGGPTQTHLPQPGSPLIERGALTECEATDQTGMPRPIDGDADGLGGCDIGAVEYVDLTGPRATLSSAPNVDLGGGTLYVVSVGYDDADAPLDLSSLGVDDIEISPGPLTVTDISVGGDADAASVAYTVLPPGGSWDAQDNGLYSIALVAGEVLDTAATGANAAQAGNLGGFRVAVGEIDVTGNGQSIPAGSALPTAANGTDFGQLAIGASAARSFSITNQALGQIELQGMIVVTGNGFSVTDQTFPLGLGPGESSDFEITFSPAVLGAAAATVSIASNDGDENPYTFSLGGQGVALTDLIFADSFEQ